MLPLIGCLKGYGVELRSTREAVTSLQWEGRLYANLVPTVCFDIHQSKGWWDDWVHESNVRSTEDLGPYKMLVSNAYRTTPYDDKLTTGRERCVLTMSIDTQPKQLWWQSTWKDAADPPWIQHYSHATSHLINPTIYQSVEWGEDWHKAFLSTPKTWQPLWTTSTQGPSLLGSLLVATLVVCESWKARMDLGRDLREGWSSMVHVCYTLNTMFLLCVLWCSAMSPGFLKFEPGDMGETSQQTEKEHCLKCITYRTTVLQLICKILYSAILYTLASLYVLQSY